MRRLRAGNFLPWLDNLQAAYYDYFVRYLVEVVRWYRDTHGITFRWAPHRPRSMSHESCPPGLHVVEVCMESGSPAVCSSRGLHA